MPMHIVISGNTPEHENLVKEAFISGFQSGGLTWEGTITVDSGPFTQELIDRYPEADMFIRSYTGFSWLMWLADQNPFKLLIMPVNDGDAESENLYDGSIPAGMVLTGIGETENISDYKVEFFDTDPLGHNAISYSNGFIAGKIAAIAKVKNCSARQARLYARIYSSLYVGPTERDGFGRIDLSRI